MQRYVDFIERISGYRNKKMIIWGAGINGRLIAEALSVAGIKTAYFVDSRQSDGILHPECLQTEDRENSIVIVSPHHIPYIIQIDHNLEKWGWKKNINYINYVADSIIAENCEDSYFDPFLGFSQIKDIEGFTIHGNEKSKNSFVLLGNCTSLSGKGRKSWVDCFTKHLEEKEKDYVLFNGASAGYASSQEILKMIRDALPLNPKVVMVVNGVIDATCANCMPNYPYFTKFEYHLMEKLFTGQHKAIKYKGMQEVPSKILFGLQNKEKNWQHYIRNLRMMRGIADECNVHFFAFLQPSLYSGPAGLMPEEKEIFRAFYGKDGVLDDLYLPANDFYKNVCQWMKKERCFYDLTQVFQGWDRKKGAYLDEIHYTDDGNEIIGDCIFQIINASQKWKDIFGGGYHEGCYFGRRNAKYFEQRKGRDSKTYGMYWRQTSVVAYYETLFKIRDK